MSSAQLGPREGSREGSLRGSLSTVYEIKIIYRFFTETPVNKNYFVSASFVCGINLFAQLRTSSPHQSICLTPDS